LHIVDRKDAKNPVADNLSRLKNVSFDPIPVNDSFPNEQLASINIISRDLPWYADYANFIVSKYLPLMRYGGDIFSPSSWESQEEGMMNIAARFSLS
jgi:hypothetical protein